MTTIARAYSRPRTLLDEFFNTDFYNHGYSTKKCYNPSVNVSEDNKGYTVSIAAPGYEREELKVTLDSNELTISTVLKEDAKVEKEFLRKEFSKSEFSRTFTLPENAQDGNIEANHTNGVLNVWIPKVEKVEIPVKEIEIK